MSKVSATEARRASGRPAKYPFATVRPNRSFVLPQSQFTKVSARSYVYQRAKRLGKKFKITEQHDGDFLVFRLK